MKKWFALIAVAFFILILVLFSMIPSEDPSLDFEEPSTESSLPKKYYSLLEISEMKKPVSKVQPGLSDEEKLALLESNDVCQVLQNTTAAQDEANSNKLELLFRLRSQVSAKPEDEELIKPMFRGPLKGEHSSDDILPAVQFFNALLFADLVDGVASKSIDYKESNYMLERLDTSDSSNAAYPLFRSVVLTELKAPAEEIRSALAAAFSRPKLDTFERRIIEAIYRQSFVSAAAHFYALEVLYKMPVVNWTRLIPVLREHLGKNAALDRAAIEFAKRLRVRGEQMNGEFEFILWSGVEYQFANIFEKYAWKNAYPGTPQPKTKHMHDLAKSYKELEALVDRMNAIMEKKIPCDPQVFQGIRDFHLKEFEKTLSKQI